ncbi:MAG: biotin/lipoyl-containing protein [Fusobacterium sp. JB021]|nr:biotin/lipoyl-containing protein [Fusobacterium sp. JB020]MDP0492775.1 biotin/lipoyl-containing protein [Fusobacterium sp. JB021]MDP0506330.1 biotin/lipoyl-containing protein [Fusobacterium sp. JB019]
MEKEEIMIDELVRILADKNLSEINYEAEELKIKIKKDLIEEVEEEVILEEEIVKEEEVFEYIKSTNIGKFYFFDKNGVPLVSVGQPIKIGQVIGYISTVGIKTPMKSDKAGVVEEILLKNGDTTDYGKALIKIK